MTEIVDEAKRRQQSLIRELESEVGFAEYKAIANHQASLWLMALALASSVAAAVMGVFLPVSSTAVGAVAIVPALIAYVAANFKLEEKSGWHYRKSHLLRGLLSRLRYQLPDPVAVEDVKSIAAARDDVNLKMLDEWNQTLTFNWLGLSRGSAPRSSESSAAQGPYRGTR